MTVMLTKENLDRIFSQIENEPRKLLAGRDIAYVLKAYREQQAEVERLKRIIADHEGWMTGTEETRLRSHNNELRSTVERLRATNKYLRDAMQVHVHNGHDFADELSDALGRA